MKKLAILGTLFIILGLILMQNKKLLVPVTELLSGNQTEVTLGEKNKYYRSYDFSYIQNTTDFMPDCKQDLLNIYYTAINAGKNEFTFYCNKDYDNCLTDLESIANDQDTLSLINNYVHPYNGFKHIETEFDNNGKITITIHKNYNATEIANIEKQLDIIEKNIVNQNLSLEANIKAIHDYIINNATYDVGRRDYNDQTYKSDTAYGALLQGYATCSGYTDAMQLMLERLGIENFKIASDNHIWNAINLDGTWKHLDLTWDDPITTTGVNTITHDYYLISTKKLLTLDQTEHNFNQEIYTELKEA